MFTLCMLYADKIKLFYSDSDSVATAVDQPHYNHTHNAYIHAYTKNIFFIIYLVQNSTFLRRLLLCLSISI